MESVPGIYCGQCAATGKRYVGSSNDMFRRVNDHKRRLLENRHNNKYLQNAWNKHGADSFIWIVLEECEAEVRLVEREQWWIDHFDSSNPKLGFNLAYPVRQRTPSAHMSRVFREWWKSLTPEEITERNKSVSATMTKMCAEPEHQQRLTDISNAYWSQDSSKEKQRVHGLRLWQDPDVRARRSKKSVPTKVHKLYLEIAGIRKPIKLWAVEAGLPYGLVKDRFNKGETIEQIFCPSYKSTPGFHMTQTFEHWLKSQLYGGAAAATGLGAM